MSFSRPYFLEGGGIPITGDKNTDLEAQFTRAWGRYPTEEEVAASIHAWAIYNYEDFVAWVKRTFPQDPAPPLRAVATQLPPQLAGMSTSTLALVAVLAIAAVLVLKK